MEMKIGAHHDELRAMEREQRDGVLRFERRDDAGALGEHEATGVGLQRIEADEKDDGTHGRDDCNPEARRTRVKTRQEPMSVWSLETRCGRSIVQDRRPQRSIGQRYGGSPSGTGNFCDHRYRHVSTTMTSA